MNEDTEAHFKAHGLEILDYEDLLKSIKDNKHLKKFVPSKFFGSIYRDGMSLFDLLNYQHDDLKRIKGFGIKKYEGYFEFRDGMMADPNPVYEYYLRELAIVNLPTQYNSQDTIAESIEKIISDFMYIYYFRGKSQIADTVKLYYGLENNRHYEYSEIATEFGLTKERVRQIIRKPKGSAVGQLFKEPLSECDRFQVHEELHTRVVDLKAHCLFNENLFDYFSNGEVISDIKHLERLVEFFDGKISKHKDCIFLTNQLEYNTIFEEHFKAIEQVLKSLDRPYILEDLLTLVKAKMVDSKFNFNPNLVESILIGNPTFFNKIESEDGSISFEVPWIELAGQALQVRRILLEAGENLTRSEILQRFNNRCQVAGKEIILDGDLYLNGREQIISYGNNVWGYGTLADNRLTCSEFIKQFLEDNGKSAHFDTVKNVLLENHYDYPDPTIRTYLTSVARVSIDNKDFFVLDDFIHQFPNIRFREKMNKKLGEQLVDKVFEIFTENGSCTKKEITKKIKDWARAEKLKGNARSSVENLLKIFTQRNIVQIEDDIYSLVNEEIQEMGTFRLRKEPSYRVLIRSLVINYLKETGNEPVSLEKLKESFKSYLPPELRIQNFYKIFNDEQLFKKQKINGKQSVTLCVDLLPEALTRQEEVEVPLAFQEVDNQIDVETRIPGRIIEREVFDLERFDQQIRLELNELGMEDAFMNTGLEKFYSALQNNGDFSRWGRTMLRSIFDLWFSRTDYYDRELCIIKLTHGFETFIKILDKDLVDCVGLSTSIRSNNGLCDLYDYANLARTIPPNSIDYQKRKFSKSIRSLLFYRNLYTHDNTNENLEMGLFNQISFASQFIALYVYAAAIME
jgi:hypothetical protein